MKNPFFFPFLCALLLGAALMQPAALWGQGEDLTQDRVFFEAQGKTYQRWLDHSGLGQYLQVRYVEVKPEQLSLFLSFPFQDLDSIRQAWYSLKTAFEAESPLTLEQQLFYKCAALMEVRQSLVDVRIFSTYDLREEPLFARAIYFDAALGRVEVESSDPMDVRRTIELNPRPVNGGKTPSVADFQRQYTRERVYRCLYSHLRTRYERRVYDDRHPTVTLLENEEVLRFEVVDLQREVLTDAANPLLCELLRGLGYDCNWVKRERLVFTIAHEPTPTGFRLVITLDGKYGSGFYKSVSRGGYLSMEVDFDDYLQHYADRLRTELREVLLNCE